MQYNMLNKSELKITNICLDNTNLNEIAECVSKILGIPSDEVLVIDVRNNEVALDILSPAVDPHSFIGSEKQLLQELKKISGVTLQKNAHITSEGMLGWIAFDAPNQETLDESIRTAEQMAQQIVERVSKRVLVYPSGAEVESGEIEDTNTPTLIAALNEAGYQAESGRVLKDDKHDIVNMLLDGINRGFGTIIITGGVGAEDKDHSVEAVLRLDPQASNPYIAKFKKGSGRHVKEGIRIAVGQMEHVRVITLPGPNDEVTECIPVLINGMKQNLTKNALAANLANVLRNRLDRKMKQYTHGT